MEQCLLTWTHCHLCLFMGAGHHSGTAVAILAGGGLHTLWFMGNGEGCSLVGGHHWLWAVDGGKWLFMGSGQLSWSLSIC